MAQFNDLIVTGVARIAQNFTIVDQAAYDGDGNFLPSTYMKKGVDYVTAGRKSGTTEGTYSTAEGLSTTASGNYSHAEGTQTNASKPGSHAEGYYTTASGNYSHAEGYSTVASQEGSHAEGYSCQAYSTTFSHAEGYRTEAYGYASSATGYYTSALATHQLVCGKYNVIDSNQDYYFIIGNGTGTSARSNGFTITKSGMIWMKYTDGNTPSTGMASSQTIPNLLNELKVLNGAMGSVYITTAYTLTSTTIATGWYNYLYIPRGTGGKNGTSNGTNTTGGTLLLFGMNAYNKAYSLAYYNSSAVYLRCFINA